MSRTALGLPEIESAREQLLGHARLTPVYSSETLSRLAGRDVYLKAENLQRTGSFKIRGAANRIAALGEDERRAGVVAASAGNHGQAVAWAAREAGIAATIFVPQDAAMAKVEAARGYGARVELVGEAFEGTLAAALEHVEATGAAFIHPYDDELVIAGQGTIGLELAEQLPQVETVLVPVGGGGLAAGVALALRGVRPRVKVIGVQADAAGFGLADGIAVKRPGEVTGRILDSVLHGMITVTGEEIAQTIVLLLERTKLLVEGAGAVGVAALLGGKVKGGDPAAALLSGGNIDPTMLISVMRHGLTGAGRYLAVRTYLTDRPGELLKLCELLTSFRANIVTIGHYREGRELPIGCTGVELTLQTRDEEHCQAVLAAMGRDGYPVDRLR